MWSCFTVQLESPDYLRRPLIQPRKHECTWSRLPTWKSISILAIGNHPHLLMGSCRLPSTVLQNHTIIVRFPVTSVRFQVFPYCNPFPSLPSLVILTSWWIPVICLVLFYKIKPLLLGSHDFWVMCFSICSSCQVPVATGREGCFRICHCDGTSRLSNCVNLECVQRKPCSLKDKTKSKLKY